MVHTLEQLLKTLCLELRQHYHHTLAGTQADIGLGQCVFVAGKEDPTILHPDIFHIHSSQFVTRQSFQAEQSGDDKLHISHIFS